MRTLIDLTPAQVLALDRLSKSQKRSRAALIRTAIDDLLARVERDVLPQAFGLWGSREIDGMIYQDKVREEW